MSDKQQTEFTKNCNIYVMLYYFFKGLISISHDHLKFTQNRTSNNVNTVNILDTFY